MKFTEAHQEARDKCLRSKGSVYWVEREDGKILDRFRKFYVQETWGSMIGGPVFIHQPFFVFGEIDWRKQGF